MVDAFLIDAACDGDVFNITLSDVAGHYELPAPAAPTRLAVKIIDMLGEEVIQTSEV